MKRTFTVFALDSKGAALASADNHDKKSWYKPRHAKKALKKLVGENNIHSFSMSKV